SACADDRLLVLHGSWLPAAERDAACFALWGEASERAHETGKRRTGAVGRRRPVHPFAATTAELRAVLDAVAGITTLTDRQVVCGDVRAEPALPSADQSRPGDRGQRD